MTKKTTPAQTTHSSSPPARRRVRGPIFTGGQIRAARMLAGVEQNEMAREIGASQKHISNLEVGAQRAAGEFALRIAEYFLTKGVVFTGEQADLAYAELGVRVLPRGEGAQRLEIDHDLRAQTIMFSPAAGPLSEDEQVGGDGTPFPPDDHPRLSLEELRAMLSGETLQAVVMLGESIKSLSKKKSGR